MALTKKNYVDLTGLSTFKSSLLGTVINDSNKATTSKTATIKAIADYVDSEVEDLSSAVTAELAKKVSSVTYDSTNKKLVYNKGGSTNTDIVTVATLKSAIGTMTGATASANGAMGLVPAPSSGKQNYFLRGDGTWAFLEGTTYTIASGDNNGQIKVTPSSGSAYNVTVKGLNTAAYRGVDTSPTSGSTNLITSGGVYDLIGIVGDIDAILDNINGEIV